MFNVTRPFSFILPLYPTNQTQLGTDVRVLPGHRGDGGTKGIHGLHLSHTNLPHGPSLRDVGHDGTAPPGAGAWAQPCPPTRPTGSSSACGSRERAREPLAGTKHPTSQTIRRGVWPVQGLPGPVVAHVRVPALPVTLWWGQGGSHHFVAVRPGSGLGHGHNRQQPAAVLRPGGLLFGLPAGVRPPHQRRWCSRVAAHHPAGTPERSRVHARVPDPGFRQWVGWQHPSERLSEGPVGGDKGPHRAGSAALLQLPRHARPPDGREAPGALLGAGTGFRERNPDTGDSSKGGRYGLPLGPTPAAPLAPLHAPLSCLPEGEEPMQLGRSCLSSETRDQRMRDQLCLYCGKAGHIIRACLVWPKDPAHSGEGS